MKLVAAERLDANEFDAALERAREQRSQWETIGQKAAAEIPSIYPIDPCGFFADQLEAVQREIITKRSQLQHSALLRRG
jgi:hypothetical protein